MSFGKAGMSRRVSVMSSRTGTPAFVAALSAAADAGAPPPPPIVLPSPRVAAVVAGAAAAATSASPKSGASDSSRSSSSSSSSSSAAAPVPAPTAPAATNDKPQTAPAAASEIAAAWAKDAVLTASSAAPAPAPATTAAAAAATAAAAVDPSARRTTATRRYSRLPPVPTQHKPSTAPAAATPKVDTSAEDGALLNPNAYRTHDSGVRFHRTVRAVTPRHALGAALSAAEYHALSGEEKAEYDRRRVSGWIVRRVRRWVRSVRARREIIACLRSFPLFSAKSVAELKPIAKCIRLIHARPKDVLVREGRVSEYTYFLISGECRLSKHNPDALLVPVDPIAAAAGHRPSTAPTGTGASVTGVSTGGSTDFILAHITSGECFGVQRIIQSSKSAAAGQQLLPASAYSTRNAAAAALAAARSAAYADRIEYQSVTCVKPGIVLAIRVNDFLAYYKKEPYRRSSSLSSNTPLSVDDANRFRKLKSALREQHRIHKSRFQSRNRSTADARLNVQSRHELSLLVGTVRAGGDLGSHAHSLSLKKFFLHRSAIAGAGARRAVSPTASAVSDDIKRAVFAANPNLIIPTYTTHTPTQTAAAVEWEPQPNREEPEAPNAATSSASTAAGGVASGARVPTRSQLRRMTANATPIVIITENKLPPSIASPPIGGVLSPLFDAATTASAGGRPSTPVLASSASASSVGVGVGVGASPQTPGLLRARTTAGTPSTASSRRATFSPSSPGAGPILSRPGTGVKDAPIAPLAGSSGVLTPSPDSRPASSGGGPRPPSAPGSNAPHPSTAAVPTSGGGASPSFVMSVIPPTPAANAATSPSFNRPTSAGFHLPVSALKFDSVPVNASGRSDGGADSATSQPSPLPGREALLSPLSGSVLPLITDSLRSPRAATTTYSAGAGGAISSSGAPGGSITVPYSHASTAEVLLRVTTERLVDTHLERYERGAHAEMRHRASALEWSPDTAQSASRAGSHIVHATNTASPGGWSHSGATEHASSTAVHKAARSSLLDSRDRRQREIARTLARRYGKGNQTGEAGDDHSPHVAVVRTGGGGTRPATEADAQHPHHHTRPHQQSSHHHVKKHGILTPEHKQFETDHSRADTHINSAQTNQSFVSGLRSASPSGGGGGSSFGKQHSNRHHQSASLTVATTGGSHRTSRGGGGGPSTGSPHSGSGSDSGSGRHKSDKPHTGPASLSGSTGTGHRRSLSAMNSSRGPNSNRSSPPPPHGAGGGGESHSPHSLSGSTSASSISPHPSGRHSVITQRKKPTPRQAGGLQHLGGSLRNLHSSASSGSLIGSSAGDSMTAMRVALLTGHAIGDSTTVDEEDKDGGGDDLDSSSDESTASNATATRSNRPMNASARGHGRSPSGGRPNRSPPASSPPPLPESSTAAGATGTPPPTAPVPLGQSQSPRTSTPLSMSHATALLRMRHRNSGSAAAGASSPPSTASSNTSDPASSSSSAAPNTNNLAPSPTASGGRPSSPGARRPASLLMLKGKLSAASAALQNMASAVVDRQQAETAQREREAAAREALAARAQQSFVYFKANTPASTTSAAGGGSGSPGGSKLAGSATNPDGILSPAGIGLGSTGSGGGDRGDRSNRSPSPSNRNRSPSPSHANAGRTPAAGVTAVSALAPATAAAPTAAAAAVDSDGEDEEKRSPPRSPLFSLNARQQAAAGTNAGGSTSVAPRGSTSGVGVVHLSPATTGGGFGSPHPSGLATLAVQITPRPLTPLTPSNSGAAAAAAGGGQLSMPSSPLPVSTHPIARGGLGVPALMSAGGEDDLLLSPATTAGSLHTTPLLLGATGGSIGTVTGTSPASLARLMELATDTAMEAELAAAAASVAATEATAVLAAEARGTRRTGESTPLRRHARSLEVAALRAREAATNAANAYASALAGANGERATTPTHSGSAGGALKVYTPGGSLVARNVLRSFGAGAGGMLSPGSTGPAAGSASLADAKAVVTPTTPQSQRKTHGRTISSVAASILPQLETMFSGLAVAAAQTTGADAGRVSTAAVVAATGKPPTPPPQAEEKFFFPFETDKAAAPNVVPPPPSTAATVTPAKPTTAVAAVPTAAAADINAVDEQYNAKLAAAIAARTREMERAAHRRPQHDNAVSGPPVTTIDIGAKMLTKLVGLLKPAPVTVKPAAVLDARLSERDRVYGRSVRGVAYHFQKPAVSAPSGDAALPPPRVGAAATAAATTGTIRASTDSGVHTRALHKRADVNTPLHARVTASPMSKFRNAADYRVRFLFPDTPTPAKIVAQEPPLGAVVSAASPVAAGAAADATAATPTAAS